MLPKHISSYVSKATIISLLIICGTATLTAQNAKKAPQTTENDTIALFRGLSVSGDIVGVAQLAFSDYGQYEAALRINLRDKYFPIVEIGYGKADADNITTNLRYKTSAPYGRIGMDFNLMKNKHDVYRIYAGFRYAFTSYKYDIEGHDITDPVWGDNAEYEIIGAKASYHWLEGVFGIDAKIWGPFRLGWSIRYKRRLFHDDGVAGNTWYVPGYGKQGGSRIGGTFNVTIEI